MQHTNNRSNRDIFIPRDSGSPKDGLFSHISSLGQIARLDFEHFNIAGETIFKVEGDAFPTRTGTQSMKSGKRSTANSNLSSP